jgi:hypothetical protein
MYGGYSLLQFINRGNVLTPVVPGGPRSCRRANADVGRVLHVHGQDILFPGGQARSVRGDRFRHSGSIGRFCPAPALQRSRLTTAPESRASQRNPRSAKPRGIRASYADLRAWPDRRVVSVADIPRCPNRVTWFRGEGANAPVKLGLGHLVCMVRTLDARLTPADAQPASST